MKRKLFINLVTIALFSIFTASVAAQTSGFVYQGKLQYGGAVGIGFWGTAVCGEDAKSIAKAIRYAANLIGVDHIALGSDFDGAVKVPFDTSGKALITEALLNENFTEEEIAKIIGGNILKLLSENLPD